MVSSFSIKHKPSNEKEQFKHERKKYYNKLKSQSSGFPFPCTERAFFIPYGAVSEQTWEDKVILHLRKLGKLNNKPEIEKTINSMLKCGTPTGRKILVSCSNPECIDSHIIDETHHCNSRTCIKEKCQIKLKKIKLKTFLPFFKDLSINPRDAEHLFLLTASPLNFDNFSEGKEFIGKCWKKFTRTNYIKRNVFLGLYVVETKSKNKKGESKGFHIHIHALFYGRRLENRIQGYCPNHKRKVFLKHDKDSGEYHCNIHNCNSLVTEHDKDSKLQKLWINSSKSKKFPKGYPAQMYMQDIKTNQKGSLEYILKYLGANKDDFSTPEDLAEYIIYTRKKKLINLFGSDLKKKFINELRIWLKNHPYKPEFYCKKCGSLLEFHSKDQETILLFEDHLRPPDPQDSPEEKLNIEYPVIHY